MNITLRKANAIQNSINDALKNIQVTTRIEINEFQDVRSVIEQANAKLFQNDHRRHLLLLALYNIRSLVSKANSSVGIDISLNKAAFVEKRIAQLELLLDDSTLTDVNVLEKKLEKISTKGSENRYGMSVDSVMTGLVNETQRNDVENQIKQLKKQKQQLNDTILELNIKTEIPLTDDVVTTLTTEGIL